jgi:hypothetical protein
MLHVRQNQRPRASVTSIPQIRAAKKGHDVHTDTDAPPAREAASAYMHTNRTSAPSWRIGIRNAAFVAHRIDSDDNGISVACFSFQKVSQSRLAFHEQLEGDCND